MSRGLGRVQILLLRALQALEAEHGEGYYYVWAVVTSAYDLSPDLQAADVQVQATRVAQRAKLRADAQVKALAESMDSEIGLRTPICVRLVQVAATDDEPAGTSVVLVAGATRLAAAKLLGWEFIDATYFEGDANAARLWEIDENLARGELTDGERAIHVAERKRIYLKDHPETQNGGDRKSDRQVGELIDRADRFTADTAAKTGQSERKVQRDARRGEKIDPEVLGSVVGTDLDKGTVLDELAATPKDAQAEKLAAIQRRERDRKAVTGPADRLVKSNATEAAAAMLIDKFHGEEMKTLLAYLERAAKNVAAAIVRQKYTGREKADRPVFDNSRAGAA